MRKIGLGIAAAMMASVLSSPVQALTTQEVLDALAVRATESQTTIDGINAALANAQSGSSTEATLERALRLEQARLRQIESFIRVVPRFPTSRLLAIVEYFDLPVSRS